MTNNTIKPDWSLYTIAVAEDEEFNFRYLKSVLSPTGIQIHWFKNGIEICEFFRAATKPKVDIILMDIKMPELDGYETLKQLLQIPVTIPVIAQTAFAFDTDITQLKLAGFTDYLIKPMGKDTIIEKLCVYLNCAQ